MTEQEKIMRAVENNIKLQTSAAVDAMNKYGQDVLCDEGVCLMIEDALLYQAQLIAPLLAECVEALRQFHLEGMSIADGTHIACSKDNCDCIGLTMNNGDMLYRVFYHKVGLLNKALAKYKEFVGGKE